MKLAFIIALLLATSPVAAQGRWSLRRSRRDVSNAMFNLALLLQRKGAYAEAIDYWRQYLVCDRASEWATRARRSLKFCEIQVNSVDRCPGRQAHSDRAA
jgi:hypothetical protein